MSNDSISIEQYNKIDFKKRVGEVEMAREKYPNKIPILCQFDISKSSIQLKSIPKLKCLVDNSMNLTDLLSAYRKKIVLNESQALFVMDYVNKQTLPHALNIELIYNQYKDKDGFLKLIIVPENTFG